MSNVLYKYSETILRLIVEGNELAVVMTDAGETNFTEYRISGAKRSINVGIAEQNSLQIACGLALSGQRVITFQKAPFSYTRTLDQMRNAVALMNLPINMVTDVLGLDGASDGASHYGVEEISIVRTIPNVKIISLTDETVAEEAAKLALTTEQPLYIRPDSCSNGILYSKDEVDFDRGFSVVKEGTDFYILATGYYTTRMINIAKHLERYQINAGVIDLYGIPFDEEELLKTIANVPKLVTVEENVLQGGLGSLILEVLNRHDVSKRVKCIGIDFKGRYPSTFGCREYFMRLYGLDDRSVLETILQWHCGLGVCVQNMRIAYNNTGNPRSIAGYGECTQPKGHMILVGAGDIGQKALKYFGKERVSFFADNNADKWETKIDGVPVIAVSELVSMKDEYDIVIATDKYYAEFGEQLTSLGVTTFYKFFSVYAYELEKKLCENQWKKVVLYGIGEELDRVIYYLGTMQRDIEAYLAEEDDNRFVGFFLGDKMVFGLSEIQEEADGVLICRKDAGLDGISKRMLD